MRIQKRLVVVSLGILLYSSSVVAQGGYMQPSQPNQGYYEAERPPVEEEPPPPEEYVAPVAYSRHDDTKHTTFGVLVGYAIDFEGWDIPAYGVAIGVRGGYTLDMGLYLGVKLTYYVGGMRYTEHVNQITAGVEVGYDIDAEPIIVRPSVDIGFETRKEFFQFAPGVSLLIPFEESYYVGLDARYLHIFDPDPIQGMSFLGNIGVRY